MRCGAATLKCGPMAKDNAVAFRDLVGVIKPSIHGLGCLTKRVG